MNKNSLFTILRVNCRAHINGWSPLAFCIFHTIINISVTLSARSITNKIERLSIIGNRHRGFVKFCIYLTAYFFRFHPFITFQFGFVHISTIFIQVNKQGLAVGGNRGACGDRSSCGYFCWASAAVKHRLGLTIPSVVPPNGAA